MADVTQTLLREQLLDRRQKLESAVTASKDNLGLQGLLNEVDAALERLRTGTYGICEVCHESVEKDRLMADPLVRYCLDHLTPAQQRELERDLELAAQIQRELLPPPFLRLDEWEIAHHYAPLGPVSGDYCDVIRGQDGAQGLFFALGDVSGKGIAASMLMAHLHAIFRTLIALGLPVRDLVERAGRIFRESTLAPYYATLVCGKAMASGEIELSNAGHCTPLLVHDGDVRHIEDGAGLPLGLFSGGQYTSQTLKLARGELLLLYTDGLTEARSSSSEEYGEGRLRQVLVGGNSLPLSALIERVIQDCAAFRDSAPMLDDLTLMAIRRFGPSARAS